MFGKPSWKIRRRIVIATLLFCAGEIVYLTGFCESTALTETIANGVLFLAGSVIGSYVFGAVWDDRNLMAAKQVGGELGPPTDFPPPVDRDV